MFSQFGLFMLFSFTSWVTIQDTLEDFVQVQADLHSQTCSATPVNDTSEVTTDFDRLESMIVILHYSNSLPFLLIFVYSILYELTFEVRKEKKSKNESLEGGSSLLSNILMLGQHLMSFFVGTIFSFTSALFIFKKFFFHAVLSAISSSNCRAKVQDRQSAIFFTFYLVFCGIFVVLLPFSRLIPKLRASIIKKFAPLEGNSSQQPTLPHFNPPRIQHQPSLAQSIISTFQQQEHPAIMPSNVGKAQQPLALPKPNTESSKAANTSIDLDFD